VVVVGGRTRTKTSDPAAPLVSWLPSGKGHNDLLLNNITAELFPIALHSLFPFDYTRGPVFLTRETEVQALLPPHAETRERYYPWMPKLAAERLISRLLSLFPSKNLFSPFPSLFPPSLYLSF